MQLRTKISVFAATAVAATSLGVTGGAVSAHTTGIHDNNGTLDRDNGRIACEKR